MHCDQNSAGSQATSGGLTTHSQSPPTRQTRQPCVGPVYSEISMAAAATPTIHANTLTVSLCAVPVKANDAKCSQF